MRERLRRDDGRGPSGNLRGDARGDSGPIESYVAVRKAGEVDGLVNVFNPSSSVMPAGAPASVGRDALAFERFRTARGLESAHDFDEILVSARTRSTGTALLDGVLECGGARGREVEHDHECRSGGVAVACGAPQATLHMSVACTPATPSRGLRASDPLRSVEPRMKHCRCVSLSS
jgi:hypothetical protein